MQGVFNLDRAMRKLSNLPKLATATMRKSGRVELDTLMNRAVQPINVI